MKAKNNFEEIIANYINGNISDAKQQVKKLSKENRKHLYQYLSDNYARSGKADNFFFNLI